MSGRFGMRAALAAVQVIMATLVAVVPIDGAAQERRIVTLDETDLPGSDYDILKEVPIEECRAACVGDARCRAFTYNHSARWCFLKDHAGKRQSYRGATSGRILESRAPVEKVTDRGLSIELNNMQSLSDRCRISMIAVNRLSADLAALSFEVEILDKSERASWQFVLLFGALPKGKTRVRQFDLENHSCEQLSRFVITGVRDCRGAGLAPSDCFDVLQVTARRGDLVVATNRPRTLETETAGADEAAAPPGEQTVQGEDLPLALPVHKDWITFASDTSTLYRTFRKYTIEPSHPEIFNLIVLSCPVYGGYEPQLSIEFPKRIGVSEGTKVTSDGGITALTIFEDGKLQHLFPRALHEGNRVIILPDSSSSQLLRILEATFIQFHFDGGKVQPLIGVLEDDEGILDEIVSVLRRKGLELSIESDDDVVGICNRDGNLVRRQVPPSDESGAVTRYGAFEYDSRSPARIRFNGPIGPRAALEFRRIVREHPTVTTLELSSLGGMVDQALLIADDVMRMEMDTVIAERHTCFSACAFIFFAGKNRKAHGRLGIHQVWNQENDARMMQATLSDVVDELNRANVDPDILTIMLRTPPDDMYVFSEAEKTKLSINR